VVRVGPFVSFGIAFDGCGTETGGGAAGPGSAADATAVDDPTTGLGLSTGVESETVSGASLTVDSGARGKNVRNDEGSKILPLVFGTMLAAGSRVSAAVCTELANFVAPLVPPFAATLPVVPMAFGFTVVSPVPFVASAKAAENFPDGATLPTDAFAGVTFAVTAGKLTITGSP
jgi:hypothetical protein